MSHPLPPPLSAASLPVFRSEEAETVDRHAVLGDEAGIQIEVKENTDLLATKETVKGEVRKTQGKEEEY